MSNEYFNATGTPSTDSEILSANLRGEYSSVESGFDKMPALAANALKGVRVNAASAALEAFESGGTYTPTVTAVLNCGTAVAGKGFWTRAGNIVTFSGLAGVTAAGAGAVTFEISLPVSSNLAADDLSGSLNPVAGAATMTLAFVSLNAATDRMLVSYTSSGAAVQSVKFVSMYEVI